MINIVATDLDGTLLNNHHRFNDALFGKVLSAIKKQQGHLVIASGEQLDWCERKFSTWQNQLAFVAANGAVVRDDDGQVISTNSFTAADLQAARRALARTGNSLFIVSGVRTAYALRQSPANFRQMISFYYPHLQTVNDWAAIQLPIIKVAVAVAEHSERDAARILNSQLGARLQAIVGGNGELDILKTGTGKGPALQILLNRFKKSHKDLLVFGDQLNDATMFRLAGESCAVSNAVPEIKALATKVIQSNDQGAVLKELASRFVNQ